MTQANPFVIAPPPALGRAHDAPSLPRYLLGIALLVGVIDIFLTMIDLIANTPEEHYSYWLLRYAAVSWVLGLLMTGSAVYWLTQVYLQRHGLGNYRQPARLLLLYGLTYLLLSWLSRVLVGYLFQWDYEQGFLSSGGMLAGIFWWAYGLALFAIKSLLSLWLFLHLFRHTAETISGPVKIAGVTLAWCFASAIVLAYLYASSYALTSFRDVLYSHALEGWEGWIVLAYGLPYLLVAFLAARGAFPRQVLGFNGGRLALACLLTLLLWIASAVVLAVLGALLMLAGSGGVSVLLVLFGLLHLVLLWPFTRLGLRWGYRAQAVA